MSSKKDTKKNHKETLVLLDAHAIIHRAYHALPEFSNSKGEPIGALYGIVAMLVNILNEIKPDYIAACFDLPKPTFRHQIFKDYKGGRKKSDDALIAQIVRSKDIFEVFKIPIYKLEGYEADDLLGTIVEQVTNNSDKKAMSGFADLDVVIASGDMDTMQLIKGKRVQVYTLKKGVKDTIMYDEDAVIERFKFVPKLLPDYKGLRGDPSDNIPGIKGIGEKTATELISKLGNLDDIYENLEKIKDPKDENNKVTLTPRILGLLLDGKDEAYFSRMLATIKEDAPIEYILPEKKWLEDVEVEPIITLLSYIELRSLMPRVKTLLGVNQNEEKKKAIIAKQISEKELQEVGIMLWLIKSDITNPTLDDILQFANTNNWQEAKDNIEKTLEQRGLSGVYEKVEKPLIPIIKNMNKVGVLINIEYFQNLSKEYHKELNRIESDIYKLSGLKFNIRSPKQLGEVLFDKLGLKSKKKTASGNYSTNEKELKKLSDDHPIINKVFEYRELQKLLSTYVDNLPQMIVAESDGGDGRLHTQFLQSGTTTGRMASQRPNMQNIPTKSEYGRRVRGGFIAPKGSVLVALDYSQIELRIAAILSKDSKMIEVFNGGGDIHTAVASEVFGVKIDDVNREMRRKAKVINFGILYGMGVKALRENLQDGISKDSDEIVTQKDAKEYLNKYFESFSGLAKWIDQTKSDAARLGYTETLYGRKRHFDGLQSKLPFIRAAAERMAVNAPIQGSSADIIKIATISANEYIENNNLNNKVKLILQVHDELIYEMPDSLWQEYALKIKEIMEGVLVGQIPTDVPIAVDIKSGQDWANLVEYKGHL